MSDQLARITRRLAATEPNPTRDAIDRDLVAEITRLRGLLARLEWHDGPFGFCPICGGRDTGGNNLAMLKARNPGWQWGHTDDCELAAALSTGRS
jgi:hypothetical protein